MSGGLRVRDGYVGIGNKQAFWCWVERGLWHIIDMTGWMAYFLEHFMAPCA